MFRLLLFIFVFMTSTAFAMPPTMSIDEVKPGMQGTAYTVIDPSGVIKPFNVSIVGTINNGKGSQPYILATASGDLINYTGGVLQGMSGSPIYINGKLVGALSAGFKDSDPNTFLITPINNMLDIWKPAPPVKVAEVEVKETANDSENVNDENADDSTDSKANFMYSGFSLNSLKNIGFSNLSVAASSTPNINFNSDIQAGSPVGVAVVLGDFLVGATGTVTVVDDNKLLAFGHSFLGVGNANYFMTDASVIGKVSGNNGMKVASVGSIIGTVTQDRSAGIGGILGKFPSIVPVNVSINEDNYSAIMAYNENFTAQLGAAIAYSALNKTADSSVSGTVKVTFDIKTDIVEGGTLSRENIFYSDADVGQLAVSELLQALTLISTNTTAESNIFGINVKMDYDTTRKTASLVSATPNKVVKPGEEVLLKVKLQPYRAEAVEVEIPYTVPSTVAPGVYVVDIHGGGLVPVTQVATAGVILPSTKSPAESYAEKIQQLLNANKNNELVIKPSVVVKTEKQLKAELKRLSKLSKRGVKPTVIKPTKFATDYVIDNVIQCTINVDKI